ncbi:hypothetical protein [Paenibacillus dendritiformis]|uniref:hypothetical protein n=1 Tax=Paenibacillus dendritiformis TaxID=130049 RepID=UPI000DA7FFAC|nr:hypothetical protein [Paenibacillus dendritiformis]PZM63713.1 hypothetical protein DOE73_20510 [Paenibacillus dendritiformis]
MKKHSNSEAQAILVEMKSISNALIRLIELVANAADENFDLFSEAMSEANVPSMDELQGYFSDAIDRFEQGVNGR